MAKVLKLGLETNFLIARCKMRYQLFVTLLMGYATVIALKCPCKRTLSCHLKEFFLAVGAASALVVWENGMLSMLR